MSRPFWHVRTTRVETVCILYVWLCLCLFLFQNNPPKNDALLFEVWEGCIRYLQNLPGEFRGIWLELSAGAVSESIMSMFGILIPGLIHFTILLAVLQILWLWMPDRWRSYGWDIVGAVCLMIQLLFVYVIVYHPNGSRPGNFWAFSILATAFLSGNILGALLFGHLSRILFKKARQA